ncbi:lipoprotein [Sulfuriferula plumbiphila]|uniref:Endolytic peptidoglycan transglycosylase RlpA n=1 Tax=Sulfuriferula plumbiphila TaxID=171865 RepID=A0A512L3E5_9PROT|nr:septal ring lytic transglycosylase RlpA family protein [Sulfuriferula plumbiphila]BBP02695.1 lipoprotein [Sulfuriferula plumbiphila]GEP28989.1 lipoprotein [Sulfuriferula plumbiphila]
MKPQFTLYIAVLVLAGCAGQPLRTVPETPATPAGGAARPAEPAASGNVAKSAKPGGYYLDDGPGDNPPPDLDAIPDAVPRPEPLYKYANRPYLALGHEYTPLATSKGYKAEGLASWYGRRFNGKRTSSGETYDMYAMTAAHPTLPLPSYARVTSLATGKSVVVRINDRGPFHSGRIIDLSYTAAHKLGIVQGGSGRVEVESITPGDIARDRDAGSDSGTYLQLGSFTRRANAEKLLARAATQLDTQSNELVIFNRDDRYRVALGPYADTDSADQAAREVQQRMNLKPVRVIR